MSRVIDLRDALSLAVPYFHHERPVAVQRNRRLTGRHADMPNHTLRRDMKPAIRQPGRPKLTAPSFEDSSTPDPWNIVLGSRHWLIVSVQCLGWPFDPVQRASICHMPGCTGGQSWACAVSAGSGSMDGGKSMAIPASR
jgi:hypothetical protein